MRIYRSNHRNTSMQRQLSLIAICGAGLWCVDTHHHPTSRPAGPRCPCVCVEVQCTAARRCKLMHCARRRPERRQVHLLPCSACWHAWRSVAAISRLCCQPPDGPALSGPAPLARCLWPQPCTDGRRVCQHNTDRRASEISRRKGAQTAALSCRPGRQILYVIDHWLVEVIGTFTLLCQSVTQYSNARLMLRSRLRSDKRPQIRMPPPAACTHIDHGYGSSKHAHMITTCKSMAQACKLLRPPLPTHGVQPARRQYPWVARAVKSSC